MRNGLGFLVALVAFGCGTNEDKWAHDSAVTTCRLLEKCYLASFKSDHDNQGDCVDDVESDNEDLIDKFYDDCDFDAEEASRCLDAANKASHTCEENDLEDVYDDCKDVWDCR
jgi:hypothetical protein